MSVFQYSQFTANHERWYYIMGNTCQGLQSMVSTNRKFLGGAFPILRKLVAHLNSEVELHQIPVTVMFEMRYTFLKAQKPSCMARQVDLSLKILIYSFTILQVPF